MEYDPQVLPYQTSENLSFAQVSVRDRWPVILTSAIDDFYRTLKDVKGEPKDEGKKIIEKLSALQYEVQHDRELVPLEDDGETDIAGYNRELAQRGKLTWCHAPWLFAECYLYRRVNVMFTLTKCWKTYDVFDRQKMSTFKSSRPAVLELATKYKGLIEELGKGTVGNSQAQVDEAAKILFFEMCEICLWGNATDLSLLTTLSYEDLQKLQGTAARKAAQSNVIANDLPAAFQILKSAQDARKDQKRQVDIVLDNAGFELFVDLILAGYLISSGLATNVVLHPKSLPWFVSDVLPKDFDELMSALADPQAFFTGRSENDLKNDTAPQPLLDQEANDIKFLHRHWRTLYQGGQLSISPNRFWTEGGSFWRLPYQQPDLLNNLKESELVIFKGDLNYRKLTGDAKWETTTPFTKAIGPMGPGSGIRVLSLRTCKADTVVGLPDGEDERLKKLPNGSDETGARKWAWSGKWAVISLSDGKP